ncbi:Fungalysin metallopeptidase-domain-containing protein [Mycena leptocephala]|nr:Fungalysin metallopeptidase-domain-containing protein [Mycena leptocephala]
MDWTFIGNVYHTLSHVLVTTYAEGLPRNADTSPSEGIESAAIAYAKRVLKDISPDSDIEYTSGYRKGDMTYAYVRQTHQANIIPFAPANIAWKNDRVVAFGHSFENLSGWRLIARSLTLLMNSVDDSDSVATNAASIDSTAAIPLAERHAIGTHNGHPPTVEYFKKPDGHLALVHVIRIQKDDAQTWHETFIDAHSGELLFLNDFVSHSSYTVLPIPGAARPSNGFKTLTDPADTTASPSGWHTVDSTTTETTDGNNCTATKGTKSYKTTKQSSATLNFEYAFNASTEPTEATNLKAACVNAFYVANTFHDFTYRYGFTEDAFNFQEYNFDRGGKEGDGVRIRVAAHPDVTNTSWFVCSPDGTPGDCVLFLYDMTKPKRNSAFDNGIIIHELTHGLTGRMTGGGTARCLLTAEAQGLGEGWSDAMADWVSQSSAPIQDYVYGAYATGDDAKGKRRYPYSTSGDKNPLRYSDVEEYTKKGKEDIHKIWIFTSAMTNPDGTEGNIMFLHLFIDSLALQPAQPTFLFARQAWLQADFNRYNGANQVLLWKALLVVVWVSAPLMTDWKQKVKAELLDTLSLKSQAIEFFDGQGRESLVIHSTSEKALTWGPFDNQMTVELTFYHDEQEGYNWLPFSTIIGDKMSEFLAYDLQTAISVIPIDDGGHGFQDYQNTTLTVNRMTLF